MHARIWLVALAVLPLVACLDADLTLHADGSVAGTIAWDTTKPLPEAAARSLLTANGVTVKRIETSPAGAAKPHVKAEVEAKSIDALASTGLLKALAVTAKLQDAKDGKRVLTVQAAKPKNPSESSEGTPNVIKLHLPGPVAETSAVSEGNDVTWTVKSSDLAGKSVELKVTYASEAQSAGPGEKKRK